MNGGHFRQGQYWGCKSIDKRLDSLEEQMAALRKDIQELVCTMAFMLGRAHDEWTEHEKFTIKELINKCDQTKALAELKEREGL